MGGTSNLTGKALSGKDHIRQSIVDILSTPLGSRQYRRDYGSRIFERVDQPMNPATKADIFIDAAEAIKKWEPRFELTRIDAYSEKPGHIGLTVEGIHLIDGEKITFGNIVI